MYTNNLSGKNLGINGSDKTNYKANFRNVFGATYSSDAIKDFIKEVFNDNKRITKK